MKLRAVLLPVGFTLFTLAARACEVCGAGQSNLFTEYTHGKTPGGAWDYVIVIAITLGTFSLLPCAVRCLRRPGESAPNHIKNVIIGQENHGD
jgi:hypothetical protein